MANEYEMVPEKDFDSLKSDVERLKKTPLGSSSEGKELKESIDKLNDSINNLLNLFKTASDSMKAESHDTDVMSKKIVPFFEKVERLSEQNEKIAKGIVALAEMFDDFKARQSGESAQKPRQNFEQQMPQNRFSQPQREMQPPMMPQSPNFNMPPMDDFSSPFGPTTQGPQPLPRMEMPPPPQAPQKKKMFGF